MTSNVFHRAARHRNLIPFTTDTDFNSGSQQFQTMPIFAIIFMLVASIASIVRAEPYEVLVIDIAGANDDQRIEEFKKDAEKFNSLERRGYSAARPYFNLLPIADGRVYFVFGFRGEVQGIHRRNYPATEKNLRRIKLNGVPKYPHMRWLPVAEIRRLLAEP